MLRRHLFAVLFALTTLGALTMGDAGADEKKEREFPPLKMGDSEKFTEVVTVRHWSKEGNKFVRSDENVRARRYSVKGEKAFIVRASDVKTPPAPDSELTDTDSNVYVVKKFLLTNNDGGHQFYVVKKP